MEIICDNGGMLLPYGGTRPLHGSETRCAVSSILVVVIVILIIIQKLELLLLNTRGCRGMQNMQRLQRQRDNSQLYNMRHSLLLSSIGPSAFTILPLKSRDHVLHFFWSIPTVESFLRPGLGVQWEMCYHRTFKSAKKINGPVKDHSHRLFQTYPSTK